jgi:hypothetical protein
MEAEEEVARKARALANVYEEKNRTINGCLMSRTNENRDGWSREIF